jgi:hypothetical protein
MAQSHWSSKLLEHLKLNGVGNYQAWKHQLRFMFMWKNSWQFVDFAIWNPYILGEPNDIVQGWIIGLTTMGLNVRLEVYAWITNCTNICVAWVRFQTWYQYVNNAACLRLKDQSSNLCLQEGRSIIEYVKQIQETQLELQGINQHVLKVERIFNNLPPNYEVIYNAFNGQDVIPTFETIAIRLIQKKMHQHTMWA